MATETKTEGAAAKPGAEGAAGAANAAGSEKSLDELLAELDDGDDTGGQQAKTKANGDVVSREEFERERQARMHTEYRTTMADAVDVLVDGLEGSLIDRDEAEDFIEGLGRRDERFRKAWSNRDSNPAQFTQLLKAAAQKYQGRVGKRGGSSGDGDSDAVTAAVLASGGKAPAAAREPNFSSMSDQDYENMVSDLNERERKASESR